MDGDEVNPDLNALASSSSRLPLPVPVQGEQVTSYMSFDRYFVSNAVCGQQTLPSHFICIFTKEIFRPRDKLSFGHREAREGDLTSGDYRFKNSKTFNVQPTFGESLPLSRLSKIQLIDLSLFTAYFKRKCQNNLSLGFNCIHWAVC